MKKIRYLQVEFDETIAGYEIPAFRGAVIKKAGEGNVLFHNHLCDDRFRYSYPLIQYKTSRNRPVIICLEEAVDEIHRFFENSDWTINLSNRELKMNISSLRVNKFTLQVWDKHYSYRIRNWLALNQKNLERYDKIESLKMRIGFLEKILLGNILSMAKGLNWTVNRRISVSIKDIQEPRFTNYKGVKLLSFNVRFKANVFLPNFMGLGKGVSLGFGVINQEKSDNEYAKTI